MSSAPVLQIVNVSKRFDATQALDAVSLSLFPGEVHALLGENGAGKSTLIKIMTGIYPPDAGQVVLNGQPVALHNAADAQRAGIAAIYQEPLVFPDLSVAENIFIGHRGRGLFVDWGRMTGEAERILTELDVHLEVRTPARGLTVAQQQAVEIAKAISLKVRVLIMDEPTASLSAHEVDQLFRLVRRLRDQGVAVLFISHRLDEVFGLADRITIFRDGRHISTRPRAEITQVLAIREMVGREVSEFFAGQTHQPGAVVLGARGLSRAHAFHDLQFDLHAGEVLGFAGLVGARRTDVGLALFGIAPATSGELVLDGRPVRIRSPQQALRAGIAYVSEDRRQLGLSLPQSLTANVTLATLRRYLNALGLLRPAAEREAAEAFRQRLHIRTPSLDQPVGQLSGGNQQKTMLAKWLNAQPRVLILDEPTRGIDVGAKAEVHHIIHDLAHQGLAILLISSDLPEVLAMSDRVLVMREGRQMGIFNREAATQERIMAAAVGLEAA
jgi:rhamnose transport system ATP-binding protein